MFQLITKKDSIFKKPLPQHIAIVMDGNGRWAQKRGLPRAMGHAAGAENYRTIATYCKDIGIQYLTVYAFSTENWKRPQEEVSTIWTLLVKYLNESIEKMQKEGIRLHILGDMTPLPEDIQQLILQTEQISSTVQGPLYNVCINYGGRDELIRAARLLAAKCREGALSPEGIDEQAVQSMLYTADLPDPDLVIRPSGEKRLSNFLLWQSAYSEFYFTDTLWPDFSVKELRAAIAEYQNRDRRYGGVKKT